MNQTIIRQLQQLKNLDQKLNRNTITLVLALIYCNACYCSDINITLESEINRFLDQEEKLATEDFLQSNLMETKISKNKDLESKYNKKSKVDYKNKITFEYDSQLSKKYKAVIKKNSIIIDIKNKKKYITPKPLITYINPSIKKGFVTILNNKKIKYLTRISNIIVLDKFINLNSTPEKEVIYKKLKTPYSNDNKIKINDDINFELGVTKLSYGKYLFNNSGGLAVAKRIENTAYISPLAYLKFGISINYEQINSSSNVSLSSLNLGPSIKFKIINSSNINLNSIVSFQGTLFSNISDGQKTYELSSNTLHIALENIFTTSIGKLITGLSYRTKKTSLKSEQISIQHNSNETTHLIGAYIGHEVDFDI